MPFWTRARISSMLHKPCKNWLPYDVWRDSPGEMSLLDLVVVPCRIPDPSSLRFMIRDTEVSLAEDCQEQFSLSRNSIMTSIARQIFMILSFDVVASATK
ncbi:hypothetical protein RRG08_046868 [Elysia crispata]|uniref:Uncharacterized protein n=1 Tax=Elysia crispata TaxID=231223 RepID=A0AAE0ZHV5_9GAST|nr:hypothetical protein RRG08_046868 [Elysia crispata]